ncbi:FecR family protein [Pedobacter heparinus]|uniref:FecR family protein n=1 Tax=Pedobacter heparinus TaxID=984 RepID=UPI0029306B3D|nr:FecR domain-containing protein [Pedobacter heparinus]
MEKEKLSELLEKMESGTATAEEVAMYNRLYMHFQKVEDWDITTMGERAEIEEELYAKITAGIQVAPKRTGSYPFFKYAAAAAAIFMAISIGIYFFKANHSPVIREQASKLVGTHDRSPGGNKATLTLANGTKISLTDATNGDLVKQSNISITKTADGQLAYKVSGAVKRPGNAASEFNSISTPNGGQYQVLLSDGSKVWLNDASSLKFPTVFTGEARSVELTGEAYFEVSKNEKMPFTVKANGMQVLVLGTHFNVMAYPDEKQVKTTLLEGAVKLIHADDVAFLKPGQQATITENGAGYQVSKADVASAMAWKNGYFLLDNASLPQLMRQISRWYDVDVIYAANLKDHEFVGEVSRKYSLMKILKILELSGVTFKLEGRTLTVK